MCRLLESAGTLWLYVEPSTYAPIIIIRIAMGIMELQLVSTKTNERMIRVPSLTSTRNIEYTNIDVSPCHSRRLRTSYTTRTRHTTLFTRLTDGRTFHLSLTVHSTRPLPSLTVSMSAPQSDGLAGAPLGLRGPDVSRVPPSKVPPSTVGRSGKATL